jgi:hypothetical protein
MPTPTTSLSEADRRRLQLTRRQRKNLTHRHPGFARFKSFFAEAGIEVEPLRHHFLEVNGQIIRFPLYMIPRRRDTAGWDAAIDDMILACCLPQLLRSVSEHVRIGSGCRADVPRRPPRGGIAVRRGEVTLATVHANRARVTGKPEIQGNFLVAGKHWQALNALIDEVEPWLMATDNRGRGSRDVEQPVSARTDVGASRDRAGRILL